MSAGKERTLPLGVIEPNSAKYFYSCAIGGVIGRLNGKLASEMTENLRVNEANDVYDGTF